MSHDVCVDLGGTAELRARGIHDQAEVRHRRNRAAGREQERHAMAVLELRIGNRVTRKTTRGEERREATGVHNSARGRSRLRRSAAGDRRGARTTEVVHGDRTGLLRCGVANDRSEAGGRNVARIHGGVGDSETSYVVAIADNPREEQAAGALRDDHEVSVATRCLNELRVVGGDCGRRRVRAEQIGRAHV